MATPEISTLQDQANVVEWLRDLQRATEAELAELLVKMEACHQEIRRLIFEVKHPTIQPNILGIKKERLNMAEAPTNWTEAAEKIREEHKENLNFDVDSYQFPENVPENLREELRRDFKLSQEIQRMMLEICEKRACGEQCAETWEEFQAMINKIALEKFGVEYGIPLPSMHSMERPLIVAKGAPLHHVTQNWLARTELEQHLTTSRGIPVRNSWTQLGDMDIAIIDTGGGIEGLPRFFPWPRYHAGLRLQKLMDTAMMRSGTSQTAESEFKAMETLKKRINGRQWESYVLNGVFPEHSERSDLHYFFRKGYPTLAVSYHDGYKGKFDSGHVLAALCLHPLGYYQATHCGLMCPTDEVICHLMMMRADEHAYWKSCGQWAASDPRSGL